MKFWEWRGGFEKPPGGVARLVLVYEKQEENKLDLLSFSPLFFLQNKSGGCEAQDMIVKASPKNAKKMNWICATPLFSCPHGIISFRKYRINLEFLCYASVESSTIKKRPRLLSF